MKKRTLIFFVLAIPVLFSCVKPIEGNKQILPKNYPAKGDKEIQVFKNAPVTYSASLKEFQENAEGLIQLINGRVILKKVELPKYEREVKLTLDIRLVSAGDAYDRSGSCFILPNGGGISMLDVAKGEKSYPEQKDALKKYPGIISGINYKPAVEALRFMTPFGVGYYNSQPLPPHVTKWADEVVWHADISHLLPLFKDGAYVGVWIDTWVNPGFKVDVKITAKESEENKAGTKKFIEPLLNTVCYAGQTFPDLFAATSVETEVLIPKKAKNSRLFYTTTGHGGHANGDEFRKRKNVIKLDEVIFDQFVPWIDSCKAFRSLNPASGVFPGGVASSDLARSNWCPGSDVKPKIYSIPDEVRGKHTFKFSIPAAQPSSQGETNFWLVSAYLAWEE